MKKILLLAISALMLLVACKSEPKTYTYEDLSFTYPASYKLEDEESSSEKLSLSLAKDDDNFMIVYVIPLDKNILSELERSEIQNNVEEDALDLLMLDVDDEDMDIDKESINALSSPEGSAPGVLLSYNGKYYGDPFKGRISVTVLRNYEILLKYEATNDKALLEMTDIATSFNVE